MIRVDDLRVGKVIPVPDAAAEGDDVHLRTVNIPAPDGEGRTRQFTAPAIAVRWFPLLGLHSGTWHLAEVPVRVNTTEPRSVVLQFDWDYGAGAHGGWFLTVDGVDYLALESFTKWMPGTVTHTVMCLFHPAAEHVGRTVRVGFKNHATMHGSNCVLEVT